MTKPDFEDLPFSERPDLTPYLIHLTKNTKAEDEFSAFDNLVSILKTGTIWPSGTDKGFIKGPNKATCFMDIPFSSLKYVINKDNSDPDNPRYEPYGVIVHKKYAYKKGCRPVMYLSNDELCALKIPKGQLWRVVRFEVTNEGWISWLHEREWRCMGGFNLLSEFTGVLVKTSQQATKLQNLIFEAPDQFKAIPRSIIPLSVVCQGLCYL